MLSEIIAAEKYLGTALAFALVFILRVHFEAQAAVKLLAAVLAFVRLIIFLFNELFVRQHVTFEVLIAVKLLSAELAFVRLIFTELSVRLHVTSEALEAVKLLSAVLAFELPVLFVSTELFVRLHVTSQALAAVKFPSTVLAFEWPVVVFILNELLDELFVREHVSSQALAGDAFLSAILAFVRLIVFIFSELSACRRATAEALAAVKRLVFLKFANHMRFRVHAEFLRAAERPEADFARVTTRAGLGVIIETLLPAGLSAVFLHVTVEMWLQ